MSITLEDMSLQDAFDSLQTHARQNQAVLVIAQTFKDIETIHHLKEEASNQLRAEQDQVQLVKDQLAELTSQLENTKTNEQSALASLETARVNSQALEAKSGEQQQRLNDLTVQISALEVNLSAKTEEMNALLGKIDQAKQIAISIIGSS